MLLAEGIERAAAWLAESTGDVRVVAVDGYSAAGKSTFADALAARTSGALVRGDDFYRVSDEDARARLSPREGVDLYYDWERLRDKAVLPLQAGHSASYHPYDWDAGHLRGERVTVAPTAVVIVEGLFVSRAELGPLVDLSVLVDTPAEVRLRRQRERDDAPEAWLARWDAAEAVYFEELRPRETFDLVVSGADPV